MGSYRIGARIVGCLDLIYSSLGLVRFLLWIMDPLIRTDSFQVVLFVVVIQGLFLEIWAAILLIVATKDGKSPVCAFKLCVVWKLTSVAWICFEVLALFMLMLLMLLRLPLSIVKWIPAIVPVIEVEASLRLAALYVVVMFMDNLKIAIGNQGQIPLRMLTPQAATSYRFEVVSSRH